MATAPGKCWDHSTLQTGRQGREKLARKALPLPKSVRNSFQTPLGCFQEGSMVHQKRPGVPAWITQGAVMVTYRAGEESLLLWKQRHQTHLCRERGGRWGTVVIRQTQQHWQLMCGDAGSPGSTCRQHRAEHNRMSCRLQRPDRAHVPEGHGEAIPKPQNGPWLCTVISDWPEVGTPVNKPIGVSAMPSTSTASAWQQGCKVPSKVVAFKLLKVSEKEFKYSHRQ